MNDKRSILIQLEDALLGGVEYLLKSQDRFALKLENRIHPHNYELLSSELDSHLQPPEFIQNDILKGVHKHLFRQLYTQSVLTEDLKEEEHKQYANKFDTSLKQLIDDNIHSIGRTHIQEHSADDLDLYAALSLYHSKDVGFRYIKTNKALFGLDRNKRKTFEDIRSNLRELYGYGAVLKRQLSKPKLGIHPDAPKLIHVGKQLTRDDVYGRVIHNYDRRRVDVYRGQIFKLDSDLDYAFLNRQGLIWSEDRRGLITPGHLIIPNSLSRKRNAYKLKQDTPNR